MNKKECYNKVYTDILWFLKNHLQDTKIYDDNLKKKFFTLKEFFSKDFKFFKNFFIHFPYNFFSYRLALEKLDDNDLKKIIKNLKKELLGDKNDIQK